MWNSFLCLCFYHFKVSSLRWMLPGNWEPGERLSFTNNTVFLFLILTFRCPLCLGKLVWKFIILVVRPELINIFIGMFKQKRERWPGFVHISNGEQIHEVRVIKLLQHDKLILRKYKCRKELNISLSRSCTKGRLCTESNLLQIEWDFKPGKM